jgi:hypothetical protein
MTQQLSIDDLAVETIEEKNPLTPNQWALHRFYERHIGVDLSHREMLEELDGYYGYSKETAEHPKRQFNDLSCLRELNHDKKVLKRHGRVQKVFVKNHFATSETEAVEFLLQEKNRVLRELKTVWIQIGKLSLEGQGRMFANGGRQFIEAIVKDIKEED